MIKMICDKGHEYNTYPSRIKDGRGCPYCSGQRVCHENSLAVKYPTLSKEWDYNKNEKTPNDYVKWSGIKVWWKCKNGHSWETRICNRSRNGNGCPYCSNQKVSNENSLSFLIPNLAKEWDICKNKEILGLLSNCVSIGSNKKAWWKCKNGHSWLATITGRVNGSGCPHCSGRYPSKENNVLIKHPVIVKDWDSNKNIKHPEEYSSSSREKVWWKCHVCKEEWEGRIDARTIGKNGCPYCSGRNATATDNLLVKYPLISKEWDYKNNKARPEDYKSHSDKKVWWKCLCCGKGWKTTISHRVEGTGCPNCSRIVLNDGEAFDSLTESFVYLEYKNDGIVIERQKRYPNSKMKCDFFIVKGNKYVEVTGYHNRSDGACSGHFSYIDYLRKIVSKRRICRENKIGFEFVKIKLTKDQIHYVRANIKNNTCN